MNKLQAFESDVATELSIQWGCKYSDALPAVENNSFYVMQGLAGSLTAFEVAIEIAKNSN